MLKRFFAIWATRWQVMGANLADLGAKLASLGAYWRYSLDDWSGCMPNAGTEVHTQRCLQRVFEGAPVTRPVGVLDIIIFCLKA